MQKKLGVKIGEEFKIMEVSSGLVRHMKYMFNDKRLVYRLDGNWERSDMLEKLVYSEYKIVKLSANKQRYYRYGNEYYSFDSLGNIKLFVWEYTPLNNEHNVQDFASILIRKRWKHKRECNRGM